LAAFDQRVPELVGGIDVRTLPLTAIDGFVLSRIDGRSTGSEIIAMTGLGGEQVEEILTRLVALGAVRFRGEVASQPPRDPAPRTFPPPRDVGAPSLPPARPTVPPRSATLPPRRRPSQGAAPRRMMSESSISAPPPDMRAFAQRARNSTPSRGKTPVPPAGASIPPPFERRESERSQRPSSQVFGSVPPFESRLPPESEHVRIRELVTAPPFESEQVQTRELAEPPSERILSFDDPRLESVRSDLRSYASSTPSSAPEPGQSAQVDPRESRAQTDPRPVQAPPKPTYDPAELDEVADLPLERKKQVLDLYHRLSQLNYYEVLGVAIGADRKDVRAAYFALSKVFHPDSLFRKELGSFKAKMTAVFQALTEAYETLSKKKSREEYDAYLRSLRSAEDAERALATEEVAQADSNVEVPRPPPVPSAAYDLPVPTPVPREASPEARRIAREVLERRLRGIAPPRAQHSDPPSSKSPIIMPAAAEPPPTNMPPDRKDLARQLTRTLIDVGKVTGSANKLTRAVSAARGAFERGDIAEAVQHMARAVALEPTRADLQGEYERLSRMLAEQLAEDYAERAKFEVKQGKWASAALSWAKVCEGRPEDSPAHRSAAYALLKAGGDLRGAQKYAQRAAFLAPDDIDARILLAQIYLTVGLKLNAKRELDAAAKLDPENEMVKNLLSELKV